MLQQLQRRRIHHHQGWISLMSMPKIITSIIKSSSNNKYHHYRHHQRHRRHFIHLPCNYPQGKGYTDTWGVIYLIIQWQNLELTLDVEEYEPWSFWRGYSEGKVSIIPCWKHLKRLRAIDLLLQNNYGLKLFPNRGSCIAYITNILNWHPYWWIIQIWPIWTGKSFVKTENTTESVAENISPTEENTSPTENSSSLPNHPKPPQPETGDGDELQKAIGVIFKNIPVVPIAICIACIFLHKKPSSIQIPTFDVTSAPFVVTFGELSYLTYEWGTNKGLDSFQWKYVQIRMFLCSIWEMILVNSLLLWCMNVSMYGVVILNVVLFFGWQRGTRNGRESFDMRPL